MQHVPVLRITRKDVIVPFNPTRPIRATIIGRVGISQLLTQVIPITFQLVFIVPQGRDGNGQRPNSLIRICHPQRRITRHLCPEIRGGGDVGSGGGEGGVGGFVSGGGGSCNIIGWYNCSNR